MPSRAKRTAALRARGIDLLTANALRRGYEHVHGDGKFAWRNVRAERRQAAFSCAGRRRERTPQRRESSRSFVHYRPKPVKLLELLDEVENAVHEAGLPRRGARLHEHPL